MTTTNTQTALSLDLAIAPGSLFADETPAPAPKPETWTIHGYERQAILDQIGPRTVLAISGGRVRNIADGVELPVSNGYTVRVQLTPADTYTVTRIFRRGAREWVKGTRSDVYCDEVSDAAYYASCFRSHDENEWTVA